MKHKILLILLVLVTLTACGKEEKSFSVAEQYGLAYAPLTIAKELGYLEEALPGYKIQWKQLMNTASIREAMIAEDLDVGFMGIPPYLIGLDKGMEWRIFMGLSSSPLSLNVMKGTNFEDFDTMHVIALPQPGSIQHILLSMYAERRYDNPKKFDPFLVSMSHPDGAIALMTDDRVVGHFTSPPYLYQEQEQEEVVELLSGEEAFGAPFTFIIGVTASSDSKALSGLQEAIDRATEFIQEQPTEAAKILSQVYHMDEELMLTYLTQGGLQFSVPVEGVDTFTDFMVRAGYLSEDFPGALYE